MKIKNIFIPVILIILTIHLLSFSTAAQKQLQPVELYIETGYTDWIDKIVFSRDGNLFATIQDSRIKIWQAETGVELGEFSCTSKVIKKNNLSCEYDEDFDEDFFKLTKRNRDVLTKYGLPPLVDSLLEPTIIATSPDGKTLIAGFGISPGMQDTEKFAIKVWDLETRRLINSNSGTSKTKTNLEVSSQKNFFAFGEWSGTAGIFDVGKNSVRILPSIGSDNEDEKKENDDESDDALFRKNIAKLTDVKISPDGKTVAVSSWYHYIALWNLLDNTVKTLDVGTNVSTFEFSPNGKFIVVNENLSVNIATDKQSKLRKPIPRWAKETKTTTKIFGNDFILQVDGALINVLKSSDKKLLASVYTYANDNYQYDWVVTTPEGRFDTNKSLDRIEGLHWIVNGEILKPLPLDVFMRQYYEPGLLQRVLASEQFKTLPSIANINRVQPKIVIKEIKPSANAADLADVTIEVENVKDVVSISTMDRTKKKQLASGAYDLRLFRDGQLVGVSAPADKLEAFIKDAPRLVSETKASGRLVDTLEDRAWREANDIFKLKNENVKFVSPDKAVYTFRNVKLPRDGRKNVEFTAYAFNADKVKSTTTAPFNFAVPNAVVNSPRKGRAFVVSIGVNASENPAYNLRYAANDARNMQRILSEKLNAKLEDGSSKYSEVVSVPLVSDYGADGKVKTDENNAQKAIIKGVFALLEGKTLKENPQLAETLKSVPKVEKIKAIEPEDTLIITYAGHGYADNSGIFYLLPYDIGADTEQLTTENLGKMISSDELSLWMRDITASEMIMIIDACHSSAAVQGDGFKPGPMGSRGLGQLAYDKDMKILSATQANNVALELNSLEQGLLSYALLQDGIKAGLADSAPKDKQLFAAEWLSYAERRVPELYTEVKAGKRSLIIDGKAAAIEAGRAVIVNPNNKQTGSLNLQQPSLFDFKRRVTKNNLFLLP